MKICLVILAVVVVVEVSGLRPPSAARIVNSRPASASRPALSSFVKKVVPHSTTTSGDVGVDMCPACIEWFQNAINALLQALLNIVVVDDCETLCSFLPKQVEDVICDILCDVVGIKEFVNLLQRTDLDPIYFCELVRACPINDHGDATITTLDIIPKSAPQGERTIDFAYHSNNGTGTGELVLLIHTVDGVPVESSFLHEVAGPGDYSSQFKLKAEPDPNCDPSQTICENWLPGNYTLRVDLCNGECGSKHPHSKIYARKEIGFVITNATISH
ncbi:hypothetical protein ScPMuIL_014900 [Solemya velum]